MALKQRYKLYAAEVRATQPWRWFASPEAAQIWIDRKVKSKWWREVCSVRHVKLVYPHTGKMSETTRDGKIGTIHVLPESLAVPTLTHEMAHLIVWIPGINDEKDHGRRFAGALIEAYRHFDCRDTAEALIKAFDNDGVLWDPYP